MYSKMCTSWWPPWFLKMCSLYQSIDNSFLITDPAALRSFTVSNRGTTRNLFRVQGNMRRAKQGWMKEKNQAFHQTRLDSLRSWIEFEILCHPNSCKGEKLKKVYLPLLKKVLPALELVRYYKFHTPRSHNNELVLVNFPLNSKQGEHE